MTDIQTTLKDINAQAPRFCFQSDPLEDIKNELSKRDFAYLLYAQPFAKSKKTWAQSLAQTGNKAAFALLCAHLKEAPASLRENSGFAFPLDHWPKEDALDGVKMWADLLQKGASNYALDLAHNSAERNQVDVLNWIKTNVEWASPIDAKDVLGFVHRSFSSESHKEVCNFVAQTINMPWRQDPRENSHPLPYTFGCALFGYTSHPTYRFHGCDRPKKYPQVTAHTIMHFQNLVGSWQSWIGMGNTRATQRACQAVELFLNPERN